MVCLCAGKKNLYVKCDYSQRHAGEKNTGCYQPVYPYAETKKLKKDFLAVFAYATGLVEEEQVFPVQVSA